jgi:general secretion pathway protein F
MTQFRYTAFGPGGERLAGVMDAATESEVIARLQRQGSLPIKAEPVGAKGSWRDRLSFDLGRPTGGSRRDAVTLFRELATMLTAGQDMDRALRFMEATAPARMRPMVAGIRSAVRDGSKLSEALALYPGAFPPMQLGLVRAGEAGGKLGPTLARIAELLERQRALASTIVSAMIYPCVLLIAMLGATTLLLTQVLPQFLPLFEQNGVALPASTQALVAVGAFIQADGVLMLLVILGLGVAVRTALQQPSMRLALDRLVLRLPLAGSLVREVLAARFARVFGTLLENGVPLIAALAIVRDAVGNHAARQAIERASLTARGGGGLTAELDAARLFPPRLIHLLRLGEETAQLGDMAMRAAEVHEQAVRVMTERLTSLLVPLMTVLMGVAVGGIVASLMTAMLSLNNLAAQ